MNAHLLYVEDDESLSFVTRDNLEMKGYRITHCANGREALEVLRNQSFDLCILDVMLPEVDGFDIAREIRRLDQHTPIIFLTAKSLKEDRIHGLKIGADDYITKPFNSEELLYRIQAILKRSQPKADLRDDIKEFNIGKYHFNYPLRILSYNMGGAGEEKFKLSPKEAQLLRMFALNANDVLPRATALTEIWGQDDYFTARSMDVFVTKLRKYLRLDENIEIVNIHGNGFQLLIKAQEKI